LNQLELETVRKEKQLIVRKNLISAISVADIVESTVQRKLPEGEVVRLRCWQRSVESVSVRKKVLIANLLTLPLNRQMMSWIFR
jgi:hypothetical protein